MNYRKVLPIFSITLLLLVTSTGSVYAATATLSNTTPGFVDSGVDTRTVTFTTTEIPAGESINNVDITVDFEKISTQDCTSPSISASFAREISMSLESPAGTIVNLVFDQTPGPATYPTIDNSPPVIVTFDDSAASLVGTTNGGIPESGTFRPAEPLSAFNDEAPHGLWTFTFGDDTFADSLCFNGLDLTLVSITINEIIVGGHLIPIDTTALLLAGFQTNTVWMLPMVLSVLGIGAFAFLFVITKKSDT